jgi:hypothetical protein
MRRGFEHFERVADTEAGRLVPGRILLEGLE